MINPPIIGRMIDFINPENLGTGIQFAGERYVASCDGQNSHLVLSMTDAQRLAVRVIVPSGKIVWHSLSPIFRRIGPGPLMIGARWDEHDFSASANRRLIASPSGPDSEDPIVFGDWDIEDQTSHFEKGSSKAKNKRRSVVQQISRVQFKRLCDILIAETQNMKRDLKDHRSGASSRILSVMKTLRKLVCRGEGDALLQRVAGYVDAPLEVYSSSLEALFGPSISQIVQAGIFGEGATMLSKLSPQAALYARTRLDFDVWLRQESWIFGRKREANETVVRSCGDKTGVHADADETPLMEGARKIWVPDHLGRNILNLWILAVAEVVIYLAENEVFPRIPADLGFQKEIQACRRI